MPNATLCGKAVTEMLLATMDPTGVAILDVIQNELVMNADLPRAYVVSKERMERCKRVLSVREQDRMGGVGWGGAVDEMRW